MTTRYKPFSMGTQLWKYNIRIRSGIRIRCMILLYCFLAQLLKVFTHYTLDFLVLAQYLSLEHDVFFIYFGNLQKIQGQRLGPKVTLILDKFFPHTVYYKSETSFLHFLNLQDFCSPYRYHFIYHCFLPQILQKNACHIYGTLDIRA